MNRRSILEAVALGPERRIAPPHDLSRERGIADLMGKHLLQRTTLVIQSRLMSDGSN